MRSSHGEIAIRHGREDETLFDPGAFDNRSAEPRVEKGILPSLKRVLSRLMLVFENFILDRIEIIVCIIVLNMDEFDKRYSSFKIVIGINVNITLLGVFNIIMPIRLFIL